MMQGQDAAQSVAHKAQGADLCHPGNGELAKNFKPRGVHEEIYI